MRLLNRVEMSASKSSITTSSSERGPISDKLGGAEITHQLLTRVLTNNSSVMFVFCLCHCSIVFNNQITARIK